MYRPRERRYGMMGRATNGGECGDFCHQHGPRRLFIQAVCLALAFARLKDGSNKGADYRNDSNHDQQLNQRESS
jgi:hypothetical protein